MAKRITNEDRVKEIFQTGDEVEAKVLLKMAALIVEMRFPVKAAEKKQRGRPVAKKAAPALPLVATSSP